jgi:DNA-binding transcriptional ArsR family regulator
MDADKPAVERAELPTEDQVAVAVRTFQLLGDGTRLRIVWALLHGEYSVGELAELVGAQPSAVSQHLAKLRLTRLVRTRRQGTRIFYAAENVHVAQLLREALYHADHVSQNLPDHGPTR